MWGFINAYRCTRTDAPPPMRCSNSAVLSGTSYWQPGHGAVDTTRNLCVLISSGVNANEILQSIKNTPPQDGHFVFFESGD